MNQKTISSNYELMIFDFYNTLVIDTEQGLKFREDVFDLIIGLKFKSKKIAIVSSSPLEEILTFSDLKKIKVFINGIYGKEDIVEENGRKYKNLGKICKDFGVNPEKAVYIADNYNDIDRSSAEKYGIKFIQISPKEKK